MKILITENQLKLLRRMDEIKTRVDEFLLFISEKSFYPIMTFENLILTVAETVSVNVANDSGLIGDEWVIFRNQIKQFIRSNLYEDIKNFWDKNK